MTENITAAYKAVKKFAASIDQQFIEVMVVRRNDYGGMLQPDSFKAYVPDCGYQDGATIAELIANLKAEHIKRGSPVREREKDDLPF